MSSERTRVRDEIANLVRARARDRAEVGDAHGRTVLMEVASEIASLYPARCAHPPPARLAAAACLCGHHYDQHGGKGYSGCWEDDCHCETFRPASPGGPG